jgi:hypothetical protein
VLPLRVHFLQDAIAKRGGGKLALLGEFNRELRQHHQYGLLYFLGLNVNGRLPWTTARRLLIILVGWGIIEHPFSQSRSPGLLVCL